MLANKLFTVLLTYADGRVERKTRVFESEQKFLCQHVIIEKGQRNSEWIVRGSNDYMLRNNFSDQIQYWRPLLLPGAVLDADGLRERLEAVMAKCEEKSDYTSLAECADLYSFFLRLGHNAGGLRVDVKREVEPMPASQNKAQGLELIAG